MSKATLRPELDLMLRLSHPACTQEMAQSLLTDIPSTFDWTYFLERAIATHFAGYLLSHPDLSEKYFPTFVLQKLKAYQQRILMHSTLLREALLAFIAQLDTAQIPYALLKGWDLHFRHGISLKKRQISDIDILIAEKDLIAVDNLLQANGFQTKLHVYKSRWHERYQLQHTPLIAQKGIICFDIHICLFTSDEPFQIDKQLLNQVQICNTENQIIKVLDQDVSSLHFYLQLHKDFYYGPHFKPSLIIDFASYPFDHSTQNLAQKWNANKELSLIKHTFQEIQSFVFSSEYSKQYLYFLSGTPLPKKIKLIKKWRNFYRRTSPFWLRIPFAWYSLFPNKTYLRYYYGTGSYFNLWLKRLIKLLKPKLKNQ